MKASQGEQENEAGDGRAVRQIAAGLFRMLVGFAQQVVEAQRHENRGDHPLEIRFQMRGGDHAHGHDNGADDHGDGHMAQTGQGRDAQRLACRPLLLPSDQDKGQPMGRQDDVHECDGESGGGDRGENSEAHPRAIACYNVTIQRLVRLGRRLTPW